MIVGEDYLEVLSKYFDEFPPFLGGKCGCPKCVNVVETVGQKKTMELGEHRVNGASSGSELVAASSGSELLAASSGSELDAGTSVDISRQPVRITAVVALLLWNQNLFESIFHGAVNDVKVPIDSLLCADMVLKGSRQDQNQNNFYPILTGTALVL
nr:phosphatidylinositol/phosphatidylcholine transfer protein SFH12-like [Tanacetum cinerariifolium]